MAMRSPLFFASLALFTSTLYLSSCSLNKSDSRITLCQAVVQKLLAIPAIDWQEHQQKTSVNSAITVRLLFSIHEEINGELHSDNFSASCIYAYSDIAEYEVVGHEYAESPTDVYINDKMVDRLTLTKVISTVMLDIAKGLFDK
jgi:hypothetical protein